MEATRLLLKKSFKTNEKILNYSADLVLEDTGMIPRLLSLLMLILLLYLAFYANITHYLYNVVKLNG